MKLVLTLLVRDEEDIIRENILFHLSQGVDRIIVTDNNSKDGTLGILREFEKEGFIDLIIEPHDDYSQWKWVTRMAKMAIEEMKADWVINCDADEFWWPLFGNLKDVLHSVSPDHKLVEALRYDFIPRPEEEGPLFKRMIIKNNNSVNHIGKPLMPKVCHRGVDDVVVGQGNHKLINPPDLKRFKERIIDIFHFPMRSYKQFANKIAMGGAAYERNTELPKTVAQGWRNLYEQFKMGTLPRYYNSKIETEEAISQKIADSNYAIDLRLKNFLYQKGIISYE